MQVATDYHSMQLQVWEALTSTCREIADRCIAIGWLSAIRTRAITRTRVRAPQHHSALIGEPDKNLLKPECRKLKGFKWHHSLRESAQRGACNHCHVSPVLIKRGVNQDARVDQFPFPLVERVPEKRKSDTGGSRDTHGTGNVSNRISRGSE
jgi:hypothetical protein